MSKAFDPSRLMTASQAEWWRSADQFALKQWPWVGDEQRLLDLMHGLGWASLCAARPLGGAGLGVDSMSCVLEALAAVSADAAAAVYASNAAHLALQSTLPGPDKDNLLRDVAGEWLAWPAFHDMAEQIWPALDAQGYLRGQVDMLLGGVHARWAVMPAQVSDQTLRLVLVDLAHPAVIRGESLRLVGLQRAGINDVEFGGVPCEVLSTDARAVFHVVSAKLVPAVLALQCGVARAAWRDTSQHASVRQQGGGPLLGWGEVKRLLSLVQERLQVMQSTWLASWHDSSLQDRQAVYVALHVGELACALAEDAVQLFGGAACAVEHAQAQRLCDARQLKGLLGGVAWRRQQLMRAC